MNIAILASIGAKNLGDELIVKNEVRLLEAEFTQAQLPPCFGHLPLRRMLFSSPSSRGRKPSTTFRGSCSFRIFTYDIAHPFFVQENIKYLEYFPIDSKNIKMLGKNFKNLLHFFGTLFWADIVVIGGGGIMYDSELQSVRNPLDQWVFRANCARFFRKKLYFYAL